MIRSCSRLIVCLCSIFSICSCSDTQHIDRNLWDEETSTYHIPAASLKISPDTPRFRTEAEPDSLPPNVEFCAVNGSTGACAMLLHPYFKNRSAGIQTLTSSDVDYFIKSMAIDQQNNFVGSSCLKMRSGVHNGTPYKQFRKDLRLYDSASGDTLNISYSGYLFNRNQSVYSLTTITLSSDFDSIGEVALFGNIYTNISHR